MSSGRYPRGVPAELPSGLSDDGLPGDLDRGAFWFLLHERRPANVAWRNAAIRYHRWSEKHRAWVEDNSLFLDTDGPDARSWEARPASRAEALEWLASHTSYSPDVADRVLSLDAELRAAGPAGRPVASVESAVEVLASVLRLDASALRRARLEVAELDRVDGGKGLNPWYVDDRRSLEWGAAKIVHDLIDLGDDPTLKLKGEAVLREALALADG